MTTNLPPQPSIAATIREHGIVLFDGECGFCTFWVRFIIDRDPNGYFLFAPLQSDVAKSLCQAELQAFGDSMLVYINGETVSRSDAVLCIVERLRFPWNVFRVGSYVPRCIRDRAYELIARNRHRLLRSNVCPLPDAEVLKRFIA
jgi:predicted DCC family thiol-disulfide oxidoreductase YuxK